MSPRDLRPALVPPPAFTPPAAAAFDGDGLRTLLHRRTDLPLVRVHVVFDGGASADPEDRSGLAELTAALLREGAGDRDAVAFAEEIERLGAAFGSAATSESVVVSVACLRRGFRAAAGLLVDAVLRPRFDAEAFRRLKTQTVGGLRQRDEQPAAAAALLGLKTLFGPGHPLGRSADGRPETVARIAIEDVRARWAQTSASPVAILAAGDVDADELAEAFAPLRAVARARAEGVAATFPAPKIVAPSRAAELRVVGADRKGSPQTVVSFAWPGPSYGDPVRPAFSLAVAVLGGSFTSRLNDNLRERRGFTYGARARADYFRGRPVAALGPGLVTASASVQASASGEAVREFLAEFERMRAGDVTAEEVAKAKATIRNARVAASETLEGLMGDLAVVTTFDLPLNRGALDLARLEAATVEDVNAAARRLLVADGGVLAVAGDRATILERFAAAGLAPPTFATEASAVT